MASRGLNICGLSFEINKKFWKAGERDIKNKVQNCGLVLNNSALSHVESVFESDFWKIRVCILTQVRIYVVVFWRMTLCSDMIWHDMIWYDMIWYDMIWYDTIWYDMTLYDMIRYDMIWHDMIWYDMIWYDMIWYDTIWYMTWYDMILFFIQHAPLPLVILHAMFT